MILQHKMLVQILIPTLESRKAVFDTLITKLQSQESPEVEIRTFVDNYEHTIGFKRNALLQSATADYTVFLDDDDDVSDNYVQLLVQAARSGKDTMTLHGQMTIDGGPGKRFIHSLKYDSYFEANNIYYRFPNHLNLMKRELIKDFAFADKSYQEDYDWAVKVHNAGVLKTEYDIDEIYYFYKYVSNK